MRQGLSSDPAQLFAVIASHIMLRAGIGAEYK